MINNADKRDEVFLNNLLENFTIHNLNFCSFDAAKIIYELQISSREGAADYDFSNGYVEKFNLHDCKMVQYGNSKLQYSHALADAITDKKMNQDGAKGIKGKQYNSSEALKNFNDEKTNVHFLHDNFFYELEEKTRKIEQYNKNAKCSNQKGLLVYDLSTLEVCYDNNLNIIEMEDINKSVCYTQHYYLVYNFDIMVKLYNSMHGKWDFLFFVTEKVNYSKSENFKKGMDIFVLDLNLFMVKDNMKKFPERFKYFCKGMRQAIVLKPGGNKIFRDENGIKLID